MKNYLPRIVGSYYNLLGLIAREKATQKAFNLFCQPKTGRLTDIDQKFLNTAENEQMLFSTSGQIKAYEWNSKGAKTILLLHGWESNSARWKNLIQLLLQDDHHVVAIDAPAHGGSEGTQFNMMLYGDFIDVAHRFFQPYFTVGHSVGGGSLAYYLSHYDGPKPQRIALLGVPSELEQMLQYYARIIGLGTRNVQSLREYVLKHTGRAIRFFSVKKFCNNIKLPTLIVHDSEDHIAKIADSQAYHNILPTSELVLTNGLGHSLQGAEVYQRIRTFMNRESGRAAGSMVCL